MGGPWFTVQQSGSRWQEIGSLWLSNGEIDGKARLQIRVSFEELEHAN